MAKSKYNPDFFHKSNSFVAFFLIYNNSICAFQ